MMDNAELEALAREARKKAVRYIHAAGSGHPGGSLSVADVLVSLYFDVAKKLVDCDYDPDDPERDVIILSKGHACPALYACWELLVERGHPKPPWWGEGPVTLRKIGSAFQGHPSRVHAPWCEASTGSLGIGFGAAVGMAHALKGTGPSSGSGRSRRVYVVLGDGELQEGLVAEAARLAAWLGLDNLTAIVDYNELASDRYSRLVDDPVEEFLAWEWGAGYCDGHDFDLLRRDLGRSFNRPRCVVANTVKGKGVPAWEDDKDGCHGSVVLSAADLQMAEEALGG